MHTSCHDLLQKFLTGTLPEPQLTRLETWLDMMKDGVVKGRGLSKPEESMIFEYITAGIDDVQNFKPQYQVRSSVLKGRWLYILGFLVSLLATALFALSFILSTDVSVKTMLPVGEEIMLNDGTIARLQIGSKLFYHQDNVGRHIELSGGAWFEAACIGSKPLIVSCGSSSIRVDFAKFYLFNDDSGGELIEQ